MDLLQPKVTRVVINRTKRVCTRGRHRTQDWQPSNTGQHGGCVPITLNSRPVVCFKTLQHAGRFVMRTVDYEIAWPLGGVCISSNDCGHWDKTSSGYRKLPFISRGRKTSDGGQTGSKAPIPTSQSDMINSVALRTSKEASMTKTTPIIADDKS